VFFGSGYYNYDEGYTPDFSGIEQFAGTVVHPQHWPEDLDYTDKKVVVIGSGCNRGHADPVADRPGRKGHDAAALADLPDVGVQVQ